MLFHTKTQKLLLLLGGMFLLLGFLSYVGLQTNFFGASLLTNQNTEGFELIGSSPKVLLGEKFFVTVAITSPQEIGKVVLGLHYDKDMIRYKGYTLNSDRYAGLTLAKVNTEEGMLYFADGRKFPETKATKETFLTLEFLALHPGKPRFTIDSHISKFSIGPSFSPYYFTTTTTQNDIPVEILAPEIRVESSAANTVVKNREIPITLTGASLVHLPIVSYKIREIQSPLHWDYIPAVPYTGAPTTFLLSEKDGVKKIQIWAQDIYGNYLPPNGPLEFTVTKDTTAPFFEKPYVEHALSLNGSGILLRNMYSNKKNPWIGWELQTPDISGIKEMIFRLKTAENTPTTLVEHTRTKEEKIHIEKELPEGKYNMELAATDMVGNSSTSTGTLIIDITPPNIESVVPALTPSSTGSGIVLSYNNTSMDEDILFYTVKIYTEDEKKLIKDVSFSPNNEHTQHIDGAYEDGKYLVLLSATDKAENTSMKENKHVLSFSSARAQENVLANRIKDLEAQLITAQKIHASAVASSGGGSYVSYANTQTIGDLQKKLNEAKKTQNASSTVSQVSNTTSSRTTPTISTLSQFPDIKNHWAISYITIMYEKKILKGYSDGTMKPNNSISRAEFIKMITVARLGTDVPPTSTPGQPSFSDVSPKVWFAPYIAYATEQKLVQGYAQNTFRPTASINRAEALSIVLKSFPVGTPSSPVKPFTDIRGTEWFASSVKTAAALGIVGGYQDGAFHPERPISRAEAAKILSYFIQK